MATLRGASKQATFAGRIAGSSYDYAAPAYGYGAPAYSYDYTPPGFWARGYWGRRYGYGW
jgi:hypothetical protein